MRYLKILLLEDDEQDAFLIKKELQESISFLLEILSVDKEKDFLLAMYEFAPDIILSDFSLPQYSGLEALRFSKSLNPHTPFVFITGRISDELAPDTVLNQADAYLSKNKLEKLPNIIQELLPWDLGQSPSKRILAIQQINQRIQQQILRNKAVLEHARKHLHRYPE